MPSTEIAPGGPGAADWRSAGHLYHSRNFYFRREFGSRVWRVSVDAGFGCPNRDGTVGTGGCVFCDPASFSPSRRQGLTPITVQIDEAIRRHRGRHGHARFVAYFQPATNTYAGVERLRQAFGEAAAHPEVVGLVIGTRPDCVGDEVLELLAGLARRTWLLVEFGLQTIHDRTLSWMNRGHDYAAFVDAWQRSRQRGLRLGAHVILGLPGESREDMRATAEELARLAVDAVKLHNLHTVRGTPLTAVVERGEVRLPELDEYAGWVVDFLERLPPNCVVDRLSGDAPPEYLVGPQWCLNKPAIRAAIEAEFGRRGTCQGARYGGGFTAARTAYIV